MSMLHHSRRFLLNTSPPATLSGGEAPAPYSDSSAGGDNAFDANIVMVLSVLLCALICSLGLNSIVRCALRCSNLVASASPESAPLRHVAAAAATGIKKKALKTFPTMNFPSAEHLNLPGLDAECAICLSEFVAGDKLRLLPKCSHGFHVRCIDKWLNSHSSCPKCRHNLLETCHKIVGEPTSRSPANSPAPATVVDILPLEHEGPIHSYRGDV